jgi:hypothetical protein
MAEIDDLLESIDLFLGETGMGPAAFGLKAANNPHLVARLRDGRDIGMATWARVRDFMTDYRRAMSKEAAAE